MFKAFSFRGIDPSKTTNWIALIIKDSITKEGIKKHWSCKHWWARFKSSKVSGLNSCQTHNRFTFSQQKDALISSRVIIQTKSKWDKLHRTKLRIPQDKNPVKRIQRSSDKRQERKQNRTGEKSRSVNIDFTRITAFKWSQRNYLSGSK